MSGCCDPGLYDQKFGSGFSRYLARRYRKRGLDRTARRMVSFLNEHGVEGASVLEIGGGVGDIQIELLRHGAARATNLELSDSYESDARALAAEAGVADRMTRCQVDIAARPDEVEPHDIVVLHRVVCCYPDGDRLLGEAAAHARRLLVYSHPPRNRVSRAVFTTENVYRRLRRDPFRGHLHDPERMIASAEGTGLRVGYRHRGFVWHVVGLAAVD
jgi:2-polyprenyl-3-methyl-5-hydroxy-6-metoxy-1,4-benzoquinol methylase